MLESVIENQTLQMSIKEAHVSDTIWNKTTKKPTPKPEQAV